MLFPPSSPGGSRTPRQVGVDFMAATRRAGATFRVQRRHTHVAHQTLDALAIDRMPPRVSSSSRIRRLP